MYCNSLSREQCLIIYAEVMEENHVDTLRDMCRNDLFFLLFIIFKRRDINRPWLYEQIREVERNPNGYLDLWARDHYKSTIITYALTIQDILKNPEITCGIFSHTKGIAKGFLGQIKRELEENSLLKELFSDILYANPQRESPKWSINEGLIVKRKTNPKESTIEAHGLVDGQPTSKHFKLRVYDDVVTKESVSTPEQIENVTEAWELSLNLGMQGGFERYIGTRYHYNDTYRTILERGSAIPRIKTATHDGTMTGRSVFLPQEVLDKKRSDQGLYTFACQMLQNPSQDSAMGFSEAWLRYYDRLGNVSGWNFYVLVDPAGEKKKKNNGDPDYTVILVIALAPDKNYYLIDAVRDRMNLTERTKKLFQFVRKYKPLKVGYEKYGMQSDIEHIEYVMEHENYRFVITPLGGSMAKNDRIRMLVPTFEQGRFYMPRQLLFLSTEGKVVDFVREFVDKEYNPFPVGLHDDMLDDMARILDPELAALFPEIVHTPYPTITLANNTNMVQTEYDLFAS